MGALHEGHLSLIRRARRDNRKVVVSIFVNPSQFGPKEDFHAYPRNFRRDAKMCKREGVDIIFAPDARQVYTHNYKTWIQVKDLSACLCGRFRPGHFRGVATVVAKLFNIVQPDTAYFGQKDAQQAIIIKRMVQDLNMPVKIRVVPTVREKGGLALSSRNAYLSPGHKEAALVLFRSLRLAKELIRKGERGANNIIRRMKQLISLKNAVRIEYISIVDPISLNPVKNIDGKCLIALAVFIGNTRLIDNIIISAPSLSRRDK
jgi:pantoate--beta-alanine ligase